MSKVNKVVRKINREILMAIVVIIFGAFMLSMVCCKYYKDSIFNTNHIRTIFNNYMRKKIYHNPYYNLYYTYRYVCKI